MKWLLWRDYRLNRPILITGLVLLLLPYAIALLVFLWPKEESNGWPRNDPSGYGNTPDVLAGLAFYSIGISQLTIAVLGGNAIAGERSDRSAEFIAYLPWKRASRLLSKFLLAALAVLIIWAPNLAVISSSRVFDTAQSREGLGFTIMAIAVTGLTFYGVGWFLSSLQSSPTFAVAGALLVPLIVIMSLTTLWEFRMIGEGGLEFGYLGTCSVLALSTFTIGTWLFLQRVEP